MHSISEVIIKSEIEMKKFGYLLANLFKCQDVVTFTGDLGVGKTFLCKTIINKLTNIIEIPSPTFNLYNTYPFKDEIEIWHCDFYRIEILMKLKKLVFLKI